MTCTCRLSGLLLAICLAMATPAVADDYLIFTDGGIPAGGSDIWTWCENSGVIPCDFRQVRECSSPEGSVSFQQQGTVQWQGFGVFHNIDPGPNGARNAWCAGASDPFPCCAGPGFGSCDGDDFATPVDLSAFMGGDLRFFVKSPFELEVQFQCEVSGAEKAGVASLTQGGWDGTATWQEIVIPLASFDFGTGPPLDLSACLSSVISPFMSTGANLGPGFHTFQIDNIRWRTANSHAGASSVQISGRELMVNGEPFVVNGIAYSPISIGEDWHGALRDRPDRYLVDFPLIAATGANTVRIYSSFLTTAMLDAAWAEGLHVIPTFGVDATQLSCPQGRDFMRDQFVDMVQEWKDHPAILLWLAGNEVNMNLGSNNLCVDWYPQLDSLAQAAHQAEGASFHPVGTANSDSPGLSEVCQASCSDDLTLPNVDFWGLQLYRGCSFGSAFTDYSAKSNCARPIIVTEFGADAWDSMSGPSGAENQSMQADCLESLLNEADQALAVRTPGGVSAGQVIFSWSDEWWKAFALDPPVSGFCSAADSTGWETHDSCKGWESLGYPDPSMNEEWWGITGVDSADPDARSIRSAQATVGTLWHPGNVCNLEVLSHDTGTGNTSMTFAPAPGSMDHTLYYGPLDAVSTYGYTGSVSGLGADGSSTATLPPGSLFYLVVGRNSTAEGGYGTGVTERPAYPGAAVPQDPNRSSACSNP